MSDRNDLNGNGWTRYQMLVLDQLEQNKKSIDRLIEEINGIKIRLAVSDTEQKLRSALFGVMGATIPVVVGIAIEIFIRK